MAKPRPSDPCLIVAPLAQSAQGTVFFHDFQPGTRARPNSKTEKVTPLGLDARQQEQADDTDIQELTLLAKLVIAAGIALMVAGMVSHPVTIGTADRIWYQELARASAPMKFRFVLQPLMAALLAIRDGRKDARAGRSPYFWAVLREPRERRARLIHGLNQTARIIVLGLTGT